MDDLKNSFRKAGIIGMVLYLISLTYAVKDFDWFGSPWYIQGIFWSGALLIVTNFIFLVVYFIKKYMITITVEPQNDEEKE